MCASLGGFRCKIICWCLACVLLKATNAVASVLQGSVHRYKDIYLKINKYVSVTFVFTKHVCENKKMISYTQPSMSERKSTTIR